MKKLIRTIALIAAVTALMALGGVVSAAPLGPSGNPQDVATLIQNIQAAPDPGAAYQALSPAEQSAVDSYLQVDRIEVESSTSVSNHHDVLMNGEWSKTNRYNVVAKTFYGLKLWTFKSQTRWYYDGTIITRTPNFTMDGETHYLFWRYLGTVWTSQTGGRNHTYHTDNGQGEFAYCPPGVGCVNHDYPVIRKRQYGDGTYSASGS